MSDELEQDVSNTIKAIQLGIESKDLDAALLRDEVYTRKPLTPALLPDPAYEAEFINELEKQLDRKGLMPQLMLEFARESFPRLEQRRVVSYMYGDATDPQNYYIRRDGVREHMGDTHGIRKMIYRNMAEHFGEINDFSPPSRWLLIDAITPKDIQRWAESQTMK